MKTLSYTITLYIVQLKSGNPDKQNSSDATNITVSLENRAVSLTIQGMGILIAHIIFLIMYISITYQLYSNGKNQILSMRGSTVWSLYLTRLSLVSPLYCSRWSFIILMELISLSSICVWGRFTCNKYQLIVLCPSSFY